MKRALITGVTGQDGSYLAELLFDNGADAAPDPLSTWRSRGRRRPTLL